ncbi:MAG: hypothetical protein AAB011_05670 [Candidatus Eisenbacteria bacterium]
MTRSLRKWFLVLLAGFIASAAAAAEKDVIVRFVAYDPPVAVDSTGVVIVELRGLWGSPNDLPDDFTFSDADLVAARIGYRQSKHLPADAFVLVNVEEWYAKDTNGLRRINPFMAPNGTTGLFAFQLTVRNRGAAPVRIDASSFTLSTVPGGEVVPPATDLTFYDRWMLGQEVAMDRRKEGPLAAIQKGYTIRHVPYPVRIAGAILAQRVPSCCGSGILDRTLLPGATATGYLLFPVEWGPDSVAISVRFDGAPGELKRQFRRSDRPYRWDRDARRWLAVGIAGR